MTFLQNVPRTLLPLPWDLYRALACSTRSIGSGVLVSSKGLDTQSPTLCEWEGVGGGGGGGGGGGAD